MTEQDITTEIEEVQEVLDLNIVGRSFGSDTVALKEEDGSWKVTVTMKERRKVEGQDWEERVVEAMCIDDNFQKAYEVSMMSALRKFDDAVVESGGDSLFSGK